MLFMDIKQEDTLRLLISVGDPSGDLYAAHIIKAIKNHPECPKNLIIDAIGGPLMKKAGATLLSQSTLFSSIGFIEPLFNLKGHLKIYKKAKQYLEERRPNLVLAIDHQGFNMKLIKEANTLNIPCDYFICPQEWQWGSQKKGEVIAKQVETLFCIFPQEDTFYKACGGNTLFVGHPIFETLCPINPDAKKDTLLILPGSRKQEIKHLKGLFSKSISTLYKDHPNLNYVCSISSPEFETPLKQAFRGLPITYIKGSPSEELLSKTVAALACSGTVTLSLALLGIPSVVAYKFHPLSYFIGKVILAKKLKQIPYIALPNYLLKRPMFEEFIQSKAKVHHIASALKRALNLRDTHNTACQFSQNQAELTQLLKNKSAAKRVALALIKKLKTSIKD